MVELQIRTPETIKSTSQISYEKASALLDLYGTPHSSRVLTEFGIESWQSSIVTAAIVDKESKLSRVIINLIRVFPGGAKILVLETLDPSSESKKVGFHTISASDGNWKSRAVYFFDTSLEFGDIETQNKINAINEPIVPKLLSILENSQTLQTTTVASLK